MDPSEWKNHQNQYIGNGQLSEGFLEIYKSAKIEIKINR